MTKGLHKNFDALLMDISKDAEIERVMIGRDDGEIRVIFRSSDGKYRVRALIEMNEDSRPHYDKIVCDTVLEAVIACEEDIAACYDD